MLYGEQSFHKLCCTLVPLCTFSSRITESVAQLTFTVTAGCILYILSTLNCAFHCFFFKYLGLNISWVLSVFFCHEGYWWLIKVIFIAAATDGTFCSWFTTQVALSHNSEWSSALLTALLDVIFGSNISFYLNLLYTLCLWKKVYFIQPVFGAHVLETTYCEH